MGPTNGLRGRTDIHHFERNDSTPASRYSNGPASPEIHLAQAEAIPARRVPAQAPYRAGGATRDRRQRPAPLRQQGPGGPIPAFEEGARLAPLPSTKEPESARPSQHHPRPNAGHRESNFQSHRFLRATN